MIAAPLRDDEERALAALRALQVLDSAPEPEFDALVRTASLVCGVPVSTLTLIDAHRQWFKAQAGMPGLSEAPRDIAFCAHAVLGDAIFEVPDARLDERFADNPLVLGEPYLRFYAGAPLRLSGGEHVGTLCVMDREPRRLDGTQREVLQQLAVVASQLLEGRRARRIERHAMAEATRAASLLQHSADAILSIDRQGRICRANAAAERLFGAAPLQLLGRPHADLVPAPLQARELNNRQALGAGEAFSHESERLRLDGQRLLVSVTLVAESGPQPEDGGATEFIRDITAREEAAQALAVSAERFRSLSDCVPVGVFHVDRSGLSGYTNERWRQIYQLSLGQVSHEAWLACVHPEDRDRVREASHLSQGGNMPFDETYRVVWPSGEIRHVRSRAQELLSLRGEPLGFVGMVEDITERRAFESQLVQARDQARAAAQEALENARLLRNIADAVPGLVAYWRRDLSCRFASRSFLDWYGRSREEMLQLTMPEVLGADAFARTQPYLGGVLAGEVQAFERSIRRPDGRLGHMLVHYVPDTDARGEVRGIFAVANDVTSLKLAQRELMLAATVLDATVDAIMVTDAQGVILSVNPAFTAITGFEAQEVLGRTLDLLGRDDPALEAQARLALRTQRHWQGELWRRRKSGEAFLQWLDVSLIPDDDGAGERLLHVFSDGTERRQRDERLRHLAFHDALTGLANRSLLMERLSRLLGQTHRERRELALMYMDLDGFKAVNDSVGHAQGDALLRLVAARMTPLVRDTDTLARLGGDEFVLLLDQAAGMQELEQVAGRLIEAVSQPVVLAGQSVVVGVSVGIARFPLDGRSVETLMRAADLAMYAAKAGGRNRWQFADPPDTA
ncbi:PAS domain S-box protein [Pelomonas sp. APW6]|uniref:PAS domain S-box protein n=1 Tax=Roseateles subflavus TaxID=3053353 RepID=A0ABT7LEN0_9BURK|nr:PAS domain S-box protein [Pelomonas sp. APW6]MDL5031312.1 PAS domain S-box protein [Pelomonas sp. APW6]